MPSEDTARARPRTALPTGLIGGSEKRVIRIVPPDPSWPERFAAERNRIRARLGPRALRIDHVGSTSVPGLAAKAIVDIDLSVDDVDDEDTYLPDLLAAGYVLRVRNVGHLMVRTPEIDVQVHVCPGGGEWERQHLLFRDHLRRDDADRRLYQALKLRLARQDWDDTNAYAQAKGPLIAEIMVRAEKWASATGWRVSQA